MRIFYFKVYWFSAYPTHRLCRIYLFLILFKLSSMGAISIWAVCLCHTRHLLFYVKQKTHPIFLQGVSFKKNVVRRSMNDQCRRRIRTPVLQLMRLVSWPLLYPAMLFPDALSPNKHPGDFTTRKEVQHRIITAGTLFS